MAIMHAACEQFREKGNIGRIGSVQGKLEERITRGVGCCIAHVSASKQHARTGKEHIIFR